MTPAELIRKAIGQRTAITPAQIRAATNGATDSGLNGGLSWMGPMQPIDAQQSQVAGRAWDFPVGVNLQYTPRGTEAINFDQLRSLADNYDLVRLLIETRKDQLVKIKFNVQAIDPKQDSDGDPRIKQVEDFLRMPDKRTMWQPWLRALIEDMLVIDAATVYPRMDRGGGLFSLELIDGATIKRVIDDFGRQPLPPQPAFQQILKGVPAVDYTSDELIYAPRNVRTHKLYGFSPLEQIVMTVNIGLRRQLSQLQYYTDGSTPDLIFSVPATWTMEQIKTYQMWWDATLAGNTAARRGTKFVPSGMSPYDTKAQALKDDYDEWLARVCCFAFSVPPSPFIKQMNRATAQNAQEAAMSEGLIPLMQWVKDLMDSVIWRYFGFTDLCFAWQEESEQDPKVQSSILDEKLRNGTITINEARAIDGLDPVPGADKLMIYTSVGAVPVEVVMAAQPAPELDPDAPAPDAEHSHQGENEPDPDKNPNAAPTAKVEKKKLAKSGVSPIDPDRQSILSIQQLLQDDLEAFLLTQAGDIAEQISAAFELDERDVEKIIDGLDFSDWIDLAKKVQPQLESAAKDGGESALIQIGQSDAEDAFHVVNEAAVQYAQDRAAEMVGMKYVDDELVPNPDAQWQITEGTRDMIRDTVTQASEEGWSNDQVADALQDNYAFSDSRAEMIARTETARADIQGSLAGYKASGLVSQKQWLTAPGCCDDCQELDGTVVGIDDEFPNDGGDGPPLHPRCRCAVLPVLDSTDS